VLADFGRPTISHPKDREATLTASLHELLRRRGRTFREDAGARFTNYQNQPGQRGVSLAGLTLKNAKENRVAGISIQ